VRAEASRAVTGTRELRRRNAVLKSSKGETQLRRRLVGSVLKNARERAGLTQHALATKLHYSSPQFVSNWERGLAMPPMDILPQLCKLLGMAPRHLIEALYAYQDEMLKLHKERLRNLFRKKFRDIR
jgi:transcriptional regulator with XRE-family HTH domain